MSLIKSKAKTSITLIKSKAKISITLIKSKAKSVNVLIKSNPKLFRCPIRYNPENDADECKERLECELHNAESDVEECPHSHNTLNVKHQLRSYGHLGTHLGKTEELGEIRNPLRGKVK